MEDQVRQSVFEALRETGASIREDAMGNLLVCIGNSQGHRVGVYCDTHVERVVLPFGDHKIYGVFHALKNCTEKLPAILFAPGMDMIKEDYPNLNDDQFLKRGMCVLSMDGLGQGETRVNGLTVDMDNYQAAGKAFIDWLVKRPEVDPDRIGAFGVSWGSYNAPLIAANDDRIKACATLLGCYFGLSRSFNTAQPGFRANFKVSVKCLKYYW